MKKIMVLMAVMFVMMVSCWAETFSFKFATDKEIKELIEHLIEKKNSMFSTASGRSLFEMKIDEFSRNHGCSTQQTLGVFKLAMTITNVSPGGIAESFIETLFDGAGKLELTGSDGELLPFDARLKLCTLRFWIVVFLDHELEVDLDRFMDDPVLKVADDWDNYFATEILFEAKDYCEKRDKKKKSK